MLLKKTIQKIQELSIVLLSFQMGLQVTIKYNVQSIYLK